MRLGHQPQRCGSQRAAPVDPSAANIAARFTVRTPLVIPESEVDAEGMLHPGLGGAVDVIFTDRIGQLPPALSNAVSPLLKTRGVVEFLVARWQKTAVGAADECSSMVEVQVTQLVGSAEPRYAAAMGKLWELSRLVDLEVSSSRLRREARLQAAAGECEADAAGGPQLVVEVLPNIIGRLPWSAVFGQVAFVSKEWKQAVDIVAPINSCRRRVAKSVLATSNRAATDARSPSQGAPPDSSTRATQPSTPTTPSPLDQEDSEAGPSKATDGKLRLPTAKWFERSLFEACGSEEVMGRLDGAADWLEHRAEKFRHGASGSSNGGGQGTARLEGLRSHLRAVRLWCAERGLFDARAQRVAGESVRERTTSTTVFGVRTGGDGAARSAAPVPIRDHTSTTGEHSWDGWMVFALAVVSASSDDRPFLCRSAIQSIGETDGLARLKMIELLCWLYLSLQRPKTRQAPTRFQAASGVSRTWQGQGSYRLQADLLVCICALENYFLRLPSTVPRRGDPAIDRSHVRAPSHCSQQRRHGYGPRSKEPILTPEQLAVVQADLRPKQVLKVMAFAGTGKTLCLRLWAQRRPQQKILYTAFNKAVVLDGVGKFQDNVMCRTVHSLAWGEVGRRYKVADGPSKASKETELKHADLRPFIKKNFPKNPSGVITSLDTKVVFGTLTKFWISKDEEITEDHIKRFRAPDAVNDGKPPPPPAPPDSWALAVARQVWLRMKVLPRNISRQERIKMTHDGYLKLYQLEQRKRPGMAKMYDTIMLDETQDSNDCILDLVMSQRRSGCRIIAVGDPHQMIYSFRGAKDHLTSMECDKVRYLTQGFRFGPTIASAANVVIRTLKMAPRPLLGNLSLSSSRPTEVLMGRDREEWLAGDAESRGRYTFLARTNATLIKEALAVMTLGGKVTFLNGMESVKLGQVESLCDMMMGNHVPSAELREIGSIERLRSMLDEEVDDELADWGHKLSMIDELMAAGRSPQQIKGDIAKLKTGAANANQQGPLVTLSSVHRAKGLEFDTVVLADDFRHDPLDAGPSWKRFSKEQANILYVAITRAKQLLVLSPRFGKQLSRLGMWDSLSLRGEPSDATVPLARRCSWCVNDVEEDAAGVTETVFARRGFLYTGSGSSKPVCAA